MKKSENLHGVLLEGLEPKDGGWIVTIGFDGTHTESSQPDGTFAMSVLSGFGSKTTKTVRVVRRVHLNNQGNFEKLT